MAGVVRCMHAKEARSKVLWDRDPLMHEQLGTFLLVTGSALDICGEHLLLSDCDILRTELFPGKGSSGRLKMTGSLPWRKGDGPLSRMIDLRDNVASE